MKKILIALVGVVAVAAVGIFAAMAYYTPAEGAFDNWHKSFDVAKSDAVKRDVPILVKVGAEL